jgi:RHS repeat-associated protein
MIGRPSDPGSVVRDSPAARQAPFELAAPPPLDLPKSGGALRGLGEKFQAGGPTGTAGVSVPLPVSPCRDNQAPSLALAYDSGARQGPFGIGWSVGVPSITRRTDKGVPRYADNDESDIFVLSGEDDLVPVLSAQHGGWAHVPTRDGPYRVDRYAPRVERGFARIERLTHSVTGDTHWRVISPDNVTSLYGLSPSARVADPRNMLHVFQWRLEATFDALGNATFYEYKAEDLAGVLAADIAEESRRANPPANIYLKRVHYGNAAPLGTRNPNYVDLADLNWFFEMVFDYGEHQTDLPAETEEWGVRQDPFSTFRSGFEIRTYRLCQRVLMFHTMPDRLGAAARLVRAIQLGYDEKPTVTYLTTVRTVGYAWNGDGAVSTTAMPTLRFDYTRVGALSTAVTSADQDSLRQAPVGIEGHGYQLVDLDGEGIAGILAAPAPPAAGLYYKRNLGGGRFGAAEPLALQPSLQTMGAGAQLLSLNGDGRLDVAWLSGPTPGYYERTRSGGWAPFAPFLSLPRFDPSARGVHFLDVDGDGLTDILIAADEVFVWYASESREGYGPPTRVSQAHEEARGAALLTSDDYETIFVADMNGDGLADLVRIRNGDICYWPNTGYGRFGARIAMQGAPLLDRVDLYDPRRIRLGDIDGTGVSDLVYLSRQGAVVYFNEAGNGWAVGIPIPLPLTASMESVRVADLLGTGTSCLVWSSAEPADARSPLRYVDLLRGTKPHLLNAIDNGLGAQTAITYAPSTQFYLEDRAAGQPWATRVPFVVQTVAQVSVTDGVSLAASQMRYRYAHGFYDGVEREFRGFARVDSWDAESMSSEHGAGPAPGAIDQHDGGYYAPPVHTVTWYHTGAWNGEGDDLRAALSAEFFAGDALAPAPSPTAIPTGLDPPALREIYRALKGRTLRQEVYAVDGAPAETAPYTVTEYRYEVRQIQPIGMQRHAVCFSFEREAITCNYERNAVDPRIAHRLSLEVDPLGYVVRSATLAYARRVPAEPEQNQTLATCATASFMAPIDTAYDFRHGAATETLKYELAMAATASVLPLGTIDAAMTGATVLPFDGALAAGSMRTIEHVRHQYWADDLSAGLPIGTVQPRALIYDRFALACPATLIASVFSGKIAPAEMTGAAGYASPDGDYWTSAGVTAYDAANFCQAVAYTDPFGNTASVVHDPERLFVIEHHSSATPRFDNVTAATIDYRVLQPAMVTDPNGNRSAAAFDELGMVVATAMMGRAGAGDTLADPTTRTVYDRLAWQNNGMPASVHIYHRNQYGAANPGWFETYIYADGVGHEALRKTQAEPDGQGRPQWVGAGRTVFDNKGDPVKKYEPYFAANPSYETESALAAVAFSEIRRYDPLARIARVDYPNGTFETRAWDPWTEIRSDAEDTVLDSAWYAAGIALPASDPLNRAAVLAAKNANTPAVQKLDPLGRAFLTIADNGPAGQFETRSSFDIQGNRTKITDPLGNLALQQVLDAQGRVLRKTGTDTGTALAIGDCLGHAYRAWDPRLFEHRMIYDVLRRLVQVWVTPPGGAEFLAEQLVYGEGLAGPNFRGHLYQRFDGAGVRTNAAYDLEGRITRTSLQLANTYQTVPAWDALAALSDPASFLPAAASLLEADVFVTSTSYDAMSRVISLTLPDSTDLVHTYNATSLLASVTAFMQGGATASPVIAAIAYNARSQRVSASYGTGMLVQYTYDDRTHRTLRVQATRRTDGASLQDLNHTYDPVHNVMQVTDLAQQTVYFAGNVTSGTQLFEYDATYRITKATGREQPGQVGYALGPNGYPDAPIGSIPGRNDLQALLAYVESYAYDAGGNLQSTVHQASGAGWTRTQTYVAGSNQLDRVSMPGDLAGGPYSGLHQHDAAGNVIAMPNLSAMVWDPAGRLISADLGGGGTAYFTYDADGQRVRKIIQRTNQVLERVYVGNFERYRERTGASLPGSALILERQSVHVADGTRRFAIVETKTVDSGAGPLTPAPLFRLQFPNSIRSTCLETDLAGSVISYEEYYPFGGSAYRAGDINKRYRFVGEERDTETGLSMCGKRYYAPWLARWISLDLLGVETQPNCYVYANNQPTFLIDTNGMQPQEEDKPASPPEISPALRERVLAGFSPGRLTLDPSLGITGPPTTGTTSSSGGNLLGPPPSDLFTPDWRLKSLLGPITLLPGLVPGGLAPTSPGLIPPDLPGPDKGAERKSDDTKPPPGLEFRLHVLQFVADRLHKPWIGSDLAFGAGLVKPFRTGTLSLGLGVLSGDSGTDIPGYPTPDSPVTVQSSQTFPYVQFTPKSSSSYYEYHGPYSTAAQSAPILWYDPDPSLGVHLKYTTPTSKTQIGLTFGWSPGNVPGLGALPNYTPITPAAPHAAGDLASPADLFLSSVLGYNKQIDAGWWLGGRFYINAW